MYDWPLEDTQLAFKQISSCSWMLYAKVMQYKYIYFFINNFAL